MDIGSVAVTFTPMANRAATYWMFQLAGWGLFILGNVLIAAVSGRAADRSLWLVSLITLIYGVGLTHALRSLIHVLGWKKHSVTSLVPRVFLVSLVLGPVFVMLTTVTGHVLSTEEIWPGIEELRTILLNSLNFSVVFLIWQIIYFAVQAFRRWKVEEINNLRLQAANTEIELNSFKAQLNPHFLFNSLNSIRALVDENPGESKRAISMLSGILRSSLLNGRKQTVPLRDELDLVENYLAMEKIRFEERLETTISVDPVLFHELIPPFMIQTLVENGIKHGISRLVKGGTVALEIRHEGNTMVIHLVNSGHYSPRSGHEGIGLENTRRRLNLLYGNRASLELQNRNECVHTELRIPITQSHESTRS